MKEKLFNNCITKFSEYVDAEALEKIREILAQELNRYEITQKETQLTPYSVIPECVKIYLVSRKIEGIKMSTLDLYALRLRQFFEMARMPVENVTTNDVRVWLYRLQNESAKGMSNRTLDGARTIICTFFKWAHSEGYIEKDPTSTIRPIKYSRNERESLTEEELELLRDCCDDIRDSAIIETFYSTGCRVSELINIKKLCIAQNENTIIAPSFNKND